MQLVNSMQCSVDAAGQLNSMLCSSLGGIAMEAESSVNIFQNYLQEENSFTNGLFATLMISQATDSRFTTEFLSLLSREDVGRLDTFRVLREIDGTADAEIGNGKCCILFETKITSGTIKEDQVRRHLGALAKKKASLRRLVLLTPDDEQSSYIDHFKSINRSLLLHLPWKKVYEFYRNRADRENDLVFKEILSQFLRRIEGKIFRQDMAGVIAKISFGQTSQV